MTSSPKKGAEAAGSAHVSATTGGAAAAVADVPEIATALDHGAVVIAAITSCTNTSNPSVMIGAGLVAKKAVERGLKRQPWVKTSLAPGSKVVTEYLQQVGPADVPRRARLQSGRIRLHDVHRQQRSAARGRVGRGRVAEPGGRVGVERQSKFRRPHPAAGPRQLSRFAAAGRRVRAGRADDDRSDDRANRHRHERRPGLSARAVADRARDSGNDAGVGDLRHVPRRSTPTCSPATIAGGSCRVPGGDRFAWDNDSTYIRNPPFFEHLTMETVPLQRHRRRARARAARRQHHDRSHLAGRLDQEGQPRRGNT